MPGKTRQVDGGVDRPIKQTLWELSAVRALWPRERALWQAPVPARMAFALKQTLCRSVKLSGSNSAGRVSASQVGRPQRCGFPSGGTTKSAQLSAAVSDGGRGSTY